MVNGRMLMVDGNSTLDLPFGYWSPGSSCTQTSWGDVCLSECPHLVVAPERSPFEVMMPLAKLITPNQQPDQPVSMPTLS